MANCKFLRQKKQVKINGEWVDTRSYRYIPYCDGGTPCMIIKNGKPNTTFIIMYRVGGSSDASMEAQTDENGYAYVEFKSGDTIREIMGYMDDESCEMVFRGLYIKSIHTVRYNLKLTISCSTLTRDGNFCDFNGSSLTLKGVDISPIDGNFRIFFQNCVNITSIDVSDFNTSNIIVNAKYDREINLIRRGFDLGKTEEEVEEERKLYLK